MLHSDSFIPCLDSLLGYSTEEFRSRLCNWLPLWCLVPWINHLLPVCWSTFWKSSLKWLWVCKFDIMENKFFIVLVMFYIYLNASQYANTLFSFTLFTCLKCGSIFLIYSTLYRRSLDNFYSHVSSTQKWYLCASAMCNQPRGEPFRLLFCRVCDYGSAEGPPRVVENRNLLSHPDDLRKEAYLIRMT